MCLCVTAALLFCCLLFLAPPLTPRGESIKLTGIDSDGRPAAVVWNVFVIENGASRPLTDMGDGIYAGLQYEGQTFYAQCTPEAFSGEEMLQILSPFPIVLFLDGNLLYADAGLDAPQLGEIVFPESNGMRMEPLLVSLPADCRGSELTIAQSQYYGGSEPVLDVYIPDTTLLSTERYNSERIAEGAEVFYPGIALFVLGLFLLIIMLTNAYTNESVVAPALLSSFCLLWMICIYLESIPLQLLGYYETLPYVPLVYFGGSTCLILFLADFMRGTPKRVLQIVALLPTGAAVAAALSLYGEETLDLSELPEIFQVGALITAVILAVVETRRVIFFTVFMRLLAVILLGFAVFVLWQAAADSAWFEGFSNEFRFMHSLAYLGSLIRILLIIACSGSLIWAFIRQLNRRRTEAAVVEERQRMAELSMKRYRRHAQETAVLQHDIRRHLGIVGMYLRQDQVPEALDYLEQIGLKVAEVPRVVATKNTVVDLVLNAKLNEMQELGITPDILAEELPPVLPLTEAEISSLLLNTLDNAIRAVETAADKTVSVQIYVRNGFLCYSCRNPVSGRQILPDHPRDGHGYGLQIVRQIAERHGGIVRVKQTDGIFALTCIISLISPVTDTKGTGPEQHSRDGVRLE